MDHTLPVLRPMRTSELLDESISLYRKNFFTFIGIVALVYVPLSVLTFVSTLLSSSLKNTPSATSLTTLLSPAYLTLVGSSLISMLLSAILVHGLATAALTRAIADNYLGKPVGIMEAFQRVGRSWLKLLGAFLLGVLIYIGVILYTIIPCVGWLTGPGLAGFLIVVVVPFIAPAIVIEKSEVRTSLRRAWDLSRRRFWWLIGYNLILLLFSALIITGPTILVSYLVRLVIGNASNYFSTTVAPAIATTLTTIIAGVIYLPFQLTGVTLAYFDLRVRTEGFDLALLTVEASAEAGVEAIPQAPVMVELKPLITWQDVGRFLLLSIGVIVFYFVLIAVLGIIGLAMAPPAG